MTRYIYKTYLSFGGDTPTAEFDVTASFGVAWSDRHYPDSQVEDIKVEFLDGRAARLCDPMTVEAIRHELEDMHWFPMLDEAYEAEGELEADRQDRRDEDNHERAWAA